MNIDFTQAPSIGIDLGTTFSAVSVYEDGSCKIIANKDGDYLTPSAVYYHPDTPEVSVGKIAQESSLDKYENFIFDVKRIIGRRFHDAYIQEMLKDRKYQYKIVSNNNEQVEVEVLHNGQVVPKSPEEISSEILKYLKESATQYLGSEVKDVVISIPAYFNNAQRKATKKAAELAGLNILKLITEPVAAAIYFCEKKIKQSIRHKSKFLVFDFGGGTLDVSIIDLGHNTFEVKSVEGNTFLGGRDIDKILIDHFKPLVIAKYGDKALNQMLFKKIEDICIRMKIGLSSRQSRTLKLDCMAGENGTIDFTMSREEFEQCMKNLLNMAIALVKKCLNESEINEDDITDVVLVGGSTRIPCVYKRLKLLFGESKLRVNLNPDEAVALGAGIQAAVLNGERQDLEKYTVTEVTPLSLGIRCAYDLMQIVIRKNSRLPVKCFVTKTTGKNLQCKASIEVYEGERKNAKDNNFLGEFLISNFPPAEAGDVKVQITFNLDEDGILEVEAHETSTGMHNRLVLTLSEFRHCDRKIRQIIKDAEINKEEDDIFENFVKYKTNITIICKRIIYNLDKIPAVEKREFVREQCNNFLVTSNVYTYKEIEKLKDEYNVFKTCVAEIIAGVLDVDMSITSIFEPVLGLPPQ